MKIRIADLTISIDNKYKEWEKCCEDYMAEPSEEEDFVISVSEEDFIQEREKGSTRLPIDTEYVCAYRDIGYKLLEYDGLILHSVLLDVNGTGVALLAESGVGKTTLARGILREYGEKARIINGDKPILRFLDGKLMAYGTPWNGKERYGCNDSVELKKLCFVRRGEYNRIEKLDFVTASRLLFRQVLMPVTEVQADAFFDLIERILDSTESYVIYCTMEREAAVTAIEGMQL